jgi:bifunctional UDP-N-acetylglucosamine pyrophosphorylase/glucosamine-1-phosphate N-acetyltransferase
VNTRTSVIVLAAGLGTRMKSKQAKVLHRAGGRCLLEHALVAAEGVAAPADIVVVVGHQAGQVQAAVAHRDVRFQLQAEQKGTGHAVAVCAGQPGLQDGRVVVIYGDCPLLPGSRLRTLLAEHEANGAAATLISMELPDATGYGRIIREADGAVAAIVEEKACTPDQKRIREANSGMYVFEAAELWPRLLALEPNPASGEVYLTDVVEALRRDGLRVARHLAPDYTELLGINTRAELAVADRILREQAAQRLMLAGVTIEKPETVTIDPDVTAGPDSIIEPFAQLLGSTRLGEGCKVGACSILRNVTLDDGAKVHAFCHLEDAHLGSEAEAGPYSRMRMGARVEPGAHAGNFVELKKTRLGAGAKAMHLAYLGDSDIGRNVNIGAGTITCNYDGRKKSKTAIADGAFVGSNSTLVAPVEIGAGSYVAAGSVITDAVPEDSLALGRSRQVIKEGWAKKRRGEPKT